jgi:hypothetical protein
MKDRRTFLNHLLAAGGVAAAAAPMAQGQSGPGGRSAEFLYLPRYARAQNYRSLKQGTWDQTGGNRDFLTRLVKIFMRRDYSIGVGRRLCSSSTSIIEDCDSSTHLNILTIRGRIFLGMEAQEDSAQGRASEVLSDCPLSNGASWGEDGSILAVCNFALAKIPSSGGTAKPLTAPTPGQNRWPQILPGGEAVLFTAYPSVTGLEGASIEVLSLKDVTV